MQIAHLDLIEVPRRSVAGVVVGDDDALELPDVARTQHEHARRATRKVVRPALQRQRSLLGLAAIERDGNARRRAGTPHVRGPHRHTILRRRGLRGGRGRQGGAALVEGALRAAAAGFWREPRVDVELAEHLVDGVEGRPRAHNDGVAEPRRREARRVIPDDDRQELPHGRRAEAELRLGARVERTRLEGWVKALGLTVLPEQREVERRVRASAAHLARAHEDVIPHHPIVQVGNFSGRVEAAVAGCLVGASIFGAFSARGVCLGALTLLIMLPI